MYGSNTFQNGHSNCHACDSLDFPKHIFVKSLDFFPHEQLQQHNLYLQDISKVPLKEIVFNIWY